MQWHAWDLLQIMQKWGDVGVYMKSQQGHEWKTSET